jgi:hypothetical protein
MKRIIKIILISFCIILLSCASREVFKIDKELTHLEVDFNKYIQKNFIFTPNEYKGTYTPLGIVHYKLRGGAELIEIEKRRSTPLVWVNENIHPNDIFVTAYQRALEMGADAVMQLKIQYDMEKYATGHGLETIYLPVIEISGVAIKRQNLLKQ